MQSFLESLFSAEGTLAKLLKKAYTLPRGHLQSFKKKLFTAEGTLAKVLKKLIHCQETKNYAIGQADIAVCTHVQHEPFVLVRLRLYIPWTLVPSLKSQVQC